MRKRSPWADRNPIHGVRTKRSPEVARLFSTISSPQLLRAFPSRCCSPAWCMQAGRPGYHEYSLPNPWCTFVLYRRGHNCLPLRPWLASCEMKSCTHARTHARARGESKMDGLQAREREKRERQRRRERREEREREREKREREKRTNFLSKDGKIRS